MLLVALAGCNSVDDTRIPASAVYIPFSDVGVWNTYGVAGALSSRSFIKASKLPSGYPYTEVSATGFGGVLLVGDFNGEPRAYDLACPVEVKASVRIAVDIEAAVAECPVCHSVYDVFRFGGPLSGTAAEKGYALTRYSVGATASGLYMLITR